MVYLLLDNIEYNFIFFFCFKIAELFSSNNIILVFGIYIEEYKAFLFCLNFFSHIICDSNILIMDEIKTTFPFIYMKQIDFYFIFELTPDDLFVKRGGKNFFW